VRRKGARAAINSKVAQAIQADRPSHRIWQRVLCWLARQPCPAAYYAAESAVLAFSARRAKAAGSRTARSARIFRSTSMPACLRPFMKTL